MKMHLGLILSSMLLPLCASAEFVCKSDLSYKWKRAGESQEEIVPWGTYRISAPDEASAKAKLAVKIEQEGAAAREACAKEHENLSGCFSTKFTAMNATMQSLDFAARKTLSEAITSDCKKQQGTCLKAEASVAACEAIVSATDGTPAADQAAGKKDEKGKKKK